MSSCFKRLQLHMISFSKDFNFVIIFLSITRERCSLSVRQSCRRNGANCPMARRILGIFDSSTVLNQILESNKIFEQIKILTILMPSFLYARKGLGDPMTALSTANRGLSKDTIKHAMQKESSQEIRYSRICSW